MELRQKPTDSSVDAAANSPGLRSSCFLHTTVWGYLMEFGMVRTQHHIPVTPRALARGDDLNETI